MSDARDGPQSGNWQYADVKLTPVFAKASKFGVLHSGCPMPLSVMLKSSEMMNNTLGFLSVGAVAAGSVACNGTRSPKARTASASRDQKDRRGKQAEVS